MYCAEENGATQPRPACFFENRSAVFLQECVKQQIVVSSYIRCGMGLQVALLIAKYKIIFIPPLATVYCTVWKNGATLPRPACFLKTDQLFFCENV